MSGFDTAATIGFFAEKNRDPRTFTHNGKTATASDWAASLGIATTSFYARLRRWGADDPRTYQPVERYYEHDGKRMTSEGWAERLGLARHTFTARLTQYGEDDPRTWKSNRDGRRPVRNPATRDMRREAMEALRELIEEDVGSREGNGPSDELVDWIVERFGALSLTEIGILYGITRERVRQIERVGLKKMRLKGGSDLRDAWSGASDRVSHWDLMALQCVGDL